MRKIPNKYRCFKYFFLSILGLALINFLRVSQGTVCSYTGLCRDELPQWLWTVSVLIVACGVGMFLYQAYRDLHKQDYLFESDWR
ncbi:hypothetical protein ACO0LO_14535 [Undibacterium sp. TJN25]|uniref:hypothetical protein n=1 Tax=Undibacterium sp. TJN25 TaxID=3413056 RepID=UPI003BF2C116